MPDAVRNSVSMRSLITGARAGIKAFSSSSLALCQPALAAYAAWPHKATASHRKTQNGVVRQYKQDCRIQISDPAGPFSSRKSPPLGIQRSHVIAVSALVKVHDSPL